MKRNKLLAILVVVVLLALLVVGCSQDFSTYGNLKVKVIDSDTIDIHYSFAKVPKAVDKGQVYLNGEVIGSVSGSGVKRFYNVAPNTTFTLTTATITLATIVSHSK